MKMSSVFIFHVFFFKSKVFKSFQASNKSPPEFIQQGKYEVLSTSLVTGDHKWILPHFKGSRAKNV